MPVYRCSPTLLFCARYLGKSVCGTFREQCQSREYLVFPELYILITNHMAIHVQQQPHTGMSKIISSRTFPPYVFHAFLSLSNNIRFIAAPPLRLFAPRFVPAGYQPFHQRGFLPTPPHSRNNTGRRSGLEGKKEDVFSCNYAHGKADNIHNSWHNIDVPRKGAHAAERVIVRRC